MNSIKTDQNFLVKSTLFNFLGTALKVIAPIFSVIVARVFGKEIFGVYVSTQLFILTLCRISVLGLDKGLNRYIPQNYVCKRIAHEGVIESLWRVVAVAFCFTLFFCTGSIFHLQNISSGLSMLSSVEISLYMLSLVPYTAIIFFAGVCEGNRKPQYKIFINDFAIMTLAPLIAIVLHFCSFNNKLALPMGLFVANIFGLFIYVILINKLFPKIKWFTLKKIPKELFNFSLPLGFAEIVASFLLRIDLWMVLALLGPEAAGIYAVMVTISNGLKTIRQGYNPILLPVVAGMNKERLDTDLKPVFSYCVSMVTLLQLAIGFFIVLFPEQVMLIAGKSYITRENPVAVLGILMVGNLVNGFLGLSGAVINGLGKSKFMLIMNVVTLIFALAMNRILIPVFGIAGAAISSMSYQILQGVWMNLYLKKMGYWPYKKYLFVQVAWIAFLMVIYVVLNNFYTATLFAKAIFYAIVILLLLLTFFKQGLMSKKN